jgi:hypothetical protein
MVSNAMPILSTPIHHVGFHRTGGANYLVIHARIEKDKAGIGFTRYFHRRPAAGFGDYDSSKRGSEKLAASLKPRWVVNCSLGVRAVRAAWGGRGFFGVNQPVGEAKAVWAGHYKFEQSIPQRCRTAIVV